MYLNVLSFTNRKTLQYRSVTPLSVDKLASDWIVVADQNTKAVYSFKSSEVVTISSVEVEEEPKIGKN